MEAYVYCDYYFVYFYFISLYVSVIVSSVIVTEYLLTKVELLDDVTLVIAAYNTTNVLQRNSTGDDVDKKGPKINCP